MIYKLSLDPDLDISAEEFAAAWNDTPECREKATAEARPGAPAMFDPFAADLVTLVAVPVAVNLFSNLVYDLAKQALRKAGERRNVRFGEPHDQPDGSKTIPIIVEDEA